MMCLYDILAELPLAKTILQPWKQMSEIERCWPYKIYKEQTICDTHMPWKHDVLMEHFPARLGISASLTAESLPHSHYHGPAPKWAWPWETPYCPDQASFQKSTFMGQKKSHPMLCSCKMWHQGQQVTVLPQLEVCLFAPISITLHT